MIHRFIIEKKLFRVVLAFFLLLVFAATPIIAGSKININTADKEALTQLKYVGPVIAERIIEYRGNHKFETPEQITEVKGVGEKTFDENKDLIVVEDG